MTNATFLVEASDSPLHLMCEGKLIRNFNFSWFVWHHGLFPTAGFAKYEQQRFSSSLRIVEKVAGVLTDSRSPTRRTGLAHDTAKSFETQNYLYSRVETLFAAFLDSILRY